MSGRKAIPYVVRPPTAVLTRGFDPRLSVGSARPAVFRSSTYVFSSPEAAERAFAIALGRARPAAGESIDLIYSRLSHPNAEILEDQVVPLEPGAESAAVFNSGMAAISTLFFAQCQPGTSFVYTAPLYGGTQHLIHQLLEPLGMKDTFFHPGEERWPRMVTAYHRAGDKLQKVENPNRFVSKTYFSGGGGLSSTAEDYAQFGMMLAAGGQWNGKRLLSPKTVEWMSSAFVPDTMQGRQPGRAYGLSVQVITDPIRAGYRVSAGSFGWDGAYGTHFWVDPKEKIVGIMMIQTDNPDRQLDRDFENAVMQAVVE